MDAREREAHAIAASIRWSEARAACETGTLPAAELGCIYIAERVHRAAGPRWLQADRDHPIPSTSPSPWVRLFAERELCRIPSPVHRALVAWADGARPVDLLFHVPSAREVLALQARGRRVVSLLEDGIPTAPHADGLAFAVHDLCHLEKFMDPAHHLEQVGFFSRAHRALDDDRFRALEASLDDAWITDRDHVIADMNGSSAFLYLALKNKLKLAVRRRLGRRAGPDDVRDLDPVEAAACDEAYETLYAALDLTGDALDAARGFSARRDGEGAAARLVAHFRAAGEAVIHGIPRAP